MEASLQRSVCATLAQAIIGKEICILLIYASIHNIFAGFHLESLLLYNSQFMW